ncbi:MAG: sulfurtransferase TusA family protein [Anaerolineales bacterium]|nr:sulfurtransferase TusA family protein [Anaerolineales bacterium]
MTLTTPVAHHTLDLSGLRCPHLVISTLHALRTLAPGQVLQIIATDLTAPSNMAAWCRQSKNPLLDVYEENGRFIFYIQHQPRSGEPYDR